ncbi:MAG: thioesterase family protein [Parerythrobacter sp.]
MDAAGIVFYPRYFELLNAAVEDWFADRLGRSFRDLHLVDRIGTPTVKLDAEFLSPAKLGDTLDIELSPEKVGNSSCTVSFNMACDQTIRLRGTVVLVCMDLDLKKAKPWPQDIAAAMRSGVRSDSDDGMA